MNSNTKTIVVCMLLLTMLVSGCSASQTPEPTVTPIPAPTNTPISTSTTAPLPTATSTPIPTSTNTSTPEPTATITATLAPVCNPGTTIPATTDEKISAGFMDISEVSTSLDGTKLTVVFTLKELPTKITLNQNKLKDGFPEIAWGVAIDTDNKLETGGKVFVLGAGSGYDAFLQVFHIKKPVQEQTDSIDKLLNTEVQVWETSETGGIRNSGAPGTLAVDLQAKTITITADIPKIMPDSYLTFYSFYTEANNPETLIYDILCRR